MQKTGAIHHGASGRLLWGGLTLLCVVGLLGARVGEDAAFQREVDAATSRATAAADEVLAPRVAPVPGSTELRFEPAELTVALQAEVFTDPSAARVRLFDPGADVLFATDGVGLGTAAPDRAAVLAALAGEGSTTTTRVPFTRATTGERGPVTDLQQVFVPIRLPGGADVVGVAEIDYLIDALRASAAGIWPAVQLVVGLALLVCLGMAVVTWVPPVREAKEPAFAVPGANTSAAREADPRATITVEPDPAIEAKIDDLEARLARAEAAAAKARAALAGTEPRAGRDTEELDDLLRRVELAEERTRDAEERLAQAGAAMRPTDGPALRARLARSADRKRPGRENTR